jgi:hypothetical protein
MNVVGTEWVDGNGHRMKITAMKPVAPHIARQSSSDVYLSYQVTYCPPDPLCVGNHAGITHEAIPVMWSEIKRGHIFGWERVMDNFNASFFEVGELVEYNMEDSGYMDAPEGWHVGTMFEIDEYDAEFPWRVTLHVDHRSFTSEQDSAWFGIARVRKYVYTISEEEEL